MTGPPPDMPPLLPNEKPANPDPVGVKLDSGKRRWGLLPFRAVGIVVDVLTFGAKKYAPDNWRKVPGARERYLDAAFRHLAAWKLGERNDPESGFSHLGHAVCCILFLAEMEEDGTL